jgi:hypothetical protein
MALTKLGLAPAGEVISGTINALNGTVGAAVDGLNYQSVSVQISGTWAGTITFQVSNDGTNWVSRNMVSSLSVLAATTTSNNIFSSDIAARYFRAIFTAYTSGTATVTIDFGGASVSNNPATQAVSGNLGATPRGVTESVETSTNLAAGATYTGASRDTSSDVAVRPTIIRPMVMHLAGQNHGTLILQESTDGTTWRETRRTPVPSDGSYYTFEWTLHLRYYRLLFINGATAQTGFYLHALRIQGDGGSIDARAMLSFLLSTAALGASATFTSPTLDLGDNHVWERARARVNLLTASSTATIRLESSHDGTVWAASAQGTATATTAGLIVIERPITERYLRVVVVNGSTAQSSNQIGVTLVSL